MTKQELAKYAGRRFSTLSTRMGGKFDTIYCATTYEITPRGTCKYVGEWMSCVANKWQRHWFREITGGRYHFGRPYAEDFASAEELEKILLPEE